MIKYAWLCYYSFLLDERLFLEILTYFLKIGRIQNYTDASKIVAMGKMVF